MFLCQVTTHDPSRIPYGVWAWPSPAETLASSASSTRTTPAPPEDTLVAVEGPRYVAQGYAYVLWRASGPLEEVADLVFQRWRADAAVVLDWLGQQSWCDWEIRGSRA